MAARRAAVNPTPTTNAALSTGEARSSTRLVLGAGSSIPRVTAAADSSSAVPVAETIRGFREILDGKHDDLPESAFLFAGTIDEVMEKAAAQPQ